MQRTSWGNGSGSKSQRQWCEPHGEKGGNFLKGDGVILMYLSNARHFNHGETKIYYTRGYLREAYQLAQKLVGRQSLEEVPAVRAGRQTSASSSARTSSLTCASFNKLGHCLFLFHGAPPDRLLCAVRGFFLRFFYPGASSEQSEARQAGKMSASK